MLHIVLFFLSIQLPISKHSVSLKRSTKGCVIQLPPFSWQSDCKLAGGRELILCYILCVASCKQVKCFQTNNWKEKIHNMICSVIPLQILSLCHKCLEKNNDSVLLGWLRLPKWLRDHFSTMISSTLSWSMISWDHSRKKLADGGESDNSFQENNSCS